MKNKVLVCFIAIVMCFFFAGCGIRKQAESIIDKAQKEVEKAESKTTEEKETTKDEEEDIKLYSDNEKIVFQNANIRHVFYYSGEQITAYYSYIEYDNKAAAEEAIKHTEKGATIKDMYVKGKYIVIEFAESQYKNLTPSTVRTAFSYMTEVKE